MKTRSILTIFIIAGAGYLVFSSWSLKRKIEALRSKLHEYDQNTPTRTGNRDQWIDWIQTALDWTAVNKQKFTDLWTQGGAFFNKPSAPSKGDVDLLIKNGEVDYSNVG